MIWASGLWATNFWASNFWVGLTPATGAGLGAVTMWVNPTTVS